MLLRDFGLMGLYSASIFLDTKKRELVRAWPYQQSRESRFVSRHNASPVFINVYVVIIVTIAM